MRAWRKPKAARKESSIENSCREYAHDRGWTSRKMNGFGFRSWPDRLFVPPIVPSKLLRMPGRSARRIGAYYNAHQVQKRRKFWVEFKRPGEESTPDQSRLQKELKARGEHVYVCDSKEEFIRVFEEHHNV